MYRFLLLNVFFLTIILSACTTGDQQNAIQQWFGKDGKVKALSTIAMIDDLVKQVGGEYVDSIALIKGELDPHSYQLVKGDDEKLAVADVIFYNGLGLEHGPSLQAYLSQNKKSVGLGNIIMAEDPSLLIYYKGQPDPHIWMDIALWSKTIPHIVNTLTSLDPAHADYFRDNGAKLLERMEAENLEVRRMLHEIPPSKRFLVTSHDAFNYFTRAYLGTKSENFESWRKRFAAPEGLSPESQISATDIQSIIDHLKEYNIHVIFPESNVNRDSIRKIVQAAKERGIDVKIAEVSLYADAMGKPGSDGDTYLKMIHHDALTISSFLQHNGG